MSSHNSPKRPLEGSEGSNKRSKYSRITASLLGRSTTGPSAPSSTLPRASSHVDEQSYDVSVAGSHTEHSLQPANSMEQDVPDAREPSPSAPTRRLQATAANISVPTEQVVSRSRALEHVDADTLPNQTESNVSSSVEHSAPGRAPPGHLGRALTGRAVKKVAMGFVRQAVDAAKVSPLKDISDLLEGFANMYIMEGTVKKEHEALRQRLQAMLTVLDNHSDMDNLPTIVSKITEIREFIEEQVRFMENKQSNKQHGRFCMAKEEEERFLACCSQVQEYMDQLTLDTSLSTSACISKIQEEQSKNNISTSLRIGKVEEEQSKEFITSRIARLPFSSSACYDSGAGAELKRRECAPGTRIHVLANLLQWAGNNSVGGVYWLNGMAGTGKTTIAYSVCKALHTELKLAASFFCSRLLDECRNVNMIIPSIAYQLAQISRPFRSALSTILDKHPDINTKRLNMQFQMLIQEPLVSVKHALPDGLVVVIDALDECDNKQSTGDILDVLLSKATDLPIKFIASSRPEPQIRDQVTEERVKSGIVLHELDTGNVQADIDTFLRQELKPMKPSPTEAQIAALVKRSGILFIYAATAVRYIGYDNFQSDPEDRLRVILDRPQSQDGQHEEIDQLYATVLETALGKPGLRMVEKNRIQQVLHTVICACDPLTVSGLSELLQIGSIDRVRSALRPLWSVLHVVGSNELVTTLHASFPDFMFDLGRSSTYHCDSKVHNRKLAELCFERIKRAQPQFNICGLESSFVPDKQVINIEQRVTSGIPSGLLYACRFWTGHIKAGACLLELTKQLEDFLSTRLLVWMEVLNLSKQINGRMEGMRLAIEWCKEFEGHTELTELVHDAQRFVDMFASNPVLQSTPHIYVSMLTFWPKSAPISKHYAKYTHGPVQAEGTALEWRQLVHLSTWEFERKIGVVAVSPNGLHVALQIDSGILVVDSSSGKRLLGPLEGHKEAVRSIAFSPDGTRIFTGSIKINKATIVGWDTLTGGIVAGPLQLQGHRGIIYCLDFSPDCSCIATGSYDKTVLQGHRGIIYCLDFSPDCSCIATGSYDKTVRLWSTESGNMLLCLATQDAVYGIVYSPNGTRIAAKIGSASLQVWDSQTGNTILGPLTDLHSIYQIAFSESIDQSRIIYLSGDSSSDIYVRDAQTGDKILGPIEGHTDYIIRIGCSPDGRYIVSGSNDRTVCVWDAQNANLVLGPLEGHTGEITSVVFSSDGSRIISACERGLVCTWDARQRNLTSSPTNTPFDEITCVKFSSDGTHFVSGSWVGTICIWDGYTGEMAAGPIKAHTSRIKAVDFLNDCVISGSEDGEICVCNVQGGAVVRVQLEVGSKWITAVAFSPNGMLVATGSSSQVDVWDVQDGSRVLGPLRATYFLHHVTSLQFSPDGTHIVASSGAIIVWDVSDGKNLFDTLDGHRSWVNMVSYSPNGALIASASNDRTIIIWDAYTGKNALGPLTGHSDSVNSVHFSSDSTRLVSGSDDGTILIWDVQTGRTLFELLTGLGARIFSVEYSPDGTRILSLADDGNVRIHDARSPEQRALSPSESEVGDWTMNKDGWVVDDQGRLLVWVPKDLREVLVESNVHVRVAPQGLVRLKFDKSRMGESWAKSYTSDL